MLKRLTILITVLVSVIFLQLGAVPLTDSVNVSPFGKVYIYKKSGTPVNVIIMISGDAGWKYGVTSFAGTFSDMNSIVIGIDVVRYFKELRQRNTECYAVSADFVNLATVIEKKYNFPDYRPAVLMGYSSGATLVYGIIAQARPGTYIGGISLGFCPDIDLPKLLCQTNGLAEKVDITGKSYFLEPNARLGNPWIVLQGKLDNICNYEEVAAFVKKTTDAEFITLSDVGHGFSKWSDFMPQWKDAYNRLIMKFNKSQLAIKDIVLVKDLPLIITDTITAGKNGPAALIISGDGGWYSFEQSIADDLALYGIPTVGYDSKKYFWTRKTPEETTADIVRAISFYGKKWGKDKFILIGYSLGAEIVPFIINRLPEEIRQNISSCVLLSPGISTDFEIHISNMLGMGNHKNTYNVIAEIARMQTGATLAVFGEDEKSNVPELLKGTSVKIGIIPGDHHYKFNVPLIIKTMRDNNVF